MHGNMIWIAAFQLAYNRIHWQVQVLCHFVNHICFKEVWHNWPSSESNFHIIKQQRRDKCMQHCSSSSYSLSNNFQGTWERSRYKKQRKRSRNTCKLYASAHCDEPFRRTLEAKIICTCNCTQCIRGAESMFPIFVDCSIVHEKRKILCNAMENHIAIWSYIDDHDRLNVCLDSQCLENEVGIWWSYVYDLCASCEKI